MAGVDPAVLLEKGYADVQKFVDKTLFQAPVPNEQKQRMIAERFGGLDDGLVSRDRRAIREKIETEPKIRKWFQDLTRLST
jgi:hypothetical protein